MAEAHLLPGKLVLVGLVHFDEAGKVLSQRQHHGRIASISERGVVLTLGSGEELVLPPDLSALQEAPAGTYVEAASGESITNPDFIASWYLFRQPGETRGWAWQSRPRFQFPPGRPDAGPGAGQVLDRLELPDDRNGPDKSGPYTC